MLKRPRDAFDTPISSSPPLPPSKRRRDLSSSLPSSSPSSVALSTPYTLPYFRSPYPISVPHDSPSNPFGLNRALRALTLPRPTGFSKHIVLRMQLVSTRDPAPASRVVSRRASTVDTPFRIVQVPLNYSVRLLHMLLLFLFASDARLSIRRKKRVLTRRNRTRDPSSTSTHNGDSVAAETLPEGHLFEVFEDAELYQNKHRPGVIKPDGRRLYAKLSSTRDRKLFPDDRPDKGGNDRGEGDVFSGGRSDADMDDSGDEGWDWEAEDDFLLSSIWTDGPNLRKAIIYHHTPATAIHITVNQTRVPPRKGLGNAPHVFAARGGTAGAVRMAHIAPAPLPEAHPPPPSSKPSRARRKRRRRDDSGFCSSGSSTASDRDSDSTSDSDSTAREEAEADLRARADEEEVPELGAREDANEAQRERWNAPGAFERFLRREAARERAMRRAPHRPHSAAKPPSRARRRGAAGAVCAQSSPLRPRPREDAHRYARRVVHASDPDAGDALDAPDVWDDGYGHDHDPAAALPPSSPSTLPIVLPSDRDWDSSAMWDEDEDEEERGGEGGENMRYMIELPLQTPFPAHPALRRRVRRASERMERQVSKGLSELSDPEEEEEPDAEGKGAEKGAEKDKEGAEKGDAEGKARADANGGLREAPRAQAKGKENVAVRAQRQAPPRAREDRAAPAGDIRKAGPKARPAAPTPKEQVDEESDESSGSGSGSGDESGGSSVESVEVDGFMMGAPWLYMRGPESEEGGRYSDEEV
ncbi:hypothetical protein BD413DRAFT_668288 [Trametes elegans]|nr:hypothetical protein BD413DRAFT_668288 [Trametes elegans]